MAMRVSYPTLARSLTLAMLVLLAGASPAFAHALYEKSQPTAGGQLEPPGQIQVWFTEEVEPSFSKIEVLDSTRRRVDLDDSQGVGGTPRALIVSVGPLGDGTYTVSWRALSAVDGHVTRGVFPLVVGAGGLSGALEEAPVFVPNVGDVAARWLGYLATLALAGGFLFRQAVLAPALATIASTRGRRADRLDAHEIRFRRLGLAATAVLIVATLVGMAFQAANAAEVPTWEVLGGPLPQLLATRLGLFWQTRLLLAVLIGLALWRARGRALWWIGLAMGAALLAAMSLTSHAAAIPSGAWLGVAVDWVHQGAAAAWVGGLVSFALIVPVVLRPLRTDQRTRALAAIIPRFSALAIVAVALLALSGAFQAWLQVSSWAAFATLYGGALLAKLALLTPLLLLGAINLLVARPRFARAALERGRRLGEYARLLIGRFRLAVAAEAALGVGVLLATAVLTASEPARETYARQPRPIDREGLAEDVGVAMTISPGRPGANTFSVRLDDGSGQPPPDVQRVTLRFTYLDQELGSGNLILQPRDDGSFGATAVNLSTDGNWQLEALVRCRGRDDVRVGWRVQVSSPETAGQAPSLEAIAPTITISPRKAAAVAFMGLGLILTFWISRSRAVRRYERLGLYAASLAVAMIGGVLYSRAIAAPAVAPDIHSLRNPFAPDAASLTRGRELYEQNCVVCHGANGRGDGPLAASLRPRPADFRVHMAAGHTDGELFTWLSKGVLGTGMPAFEGQISEADRWHLINYIRGFAPQTE